MLIVDDYLVTASEDTTVRVWDAGDVHPICTLHGHSARVTCLCATRQQQRQAQLFTAPSWYIFTGSDDCTARQWDLNTKQQTCVMEGHTSSVLSVAVASAHETREEIVAVGSRDRTATLWLLPRCQQIRCFHGHIGWVRTIMIDARAAAAREHWGAFQKRLEFDRDPTRSQSALTRFKRAGRAVHSNSVVSDYFVYTGSFDKCVKRW